MCKSKWTLGLKEDDMKLGRKSRERNQGGPEKGKGTSFIKVHYTPMCGSQTIQKRKRILLPQLIAYQIVQIILSKSYQKQEWRSTADAASQIMQCSHHVHKLILKFPELRGNMILGVNLPMYNVATLIDWFMIDHGSILQMEKHSLKQSLLSQFYHQYMIKWTLVRRFSNVNPNVLPKYQKRNCNSPNKWNN